MVIRDESILDCYRLAKFYHVSPTVFLEMGLTEVRTHLERTIDLQHMINRESAPDDG